jgi:uncharacterized membrane protein YhaH (DUF805 family)
MKCHACNEVILPEDRHCSRCGREVKREYTNMNDFEFKEYNPRSKESIDANQFNKDSKVEVSGFDAYQLMWKKYADFEGRTTKTEFWYAMLFHMIFVAIAASTVYLEPIYFLATVVPYLAISVRRLHDTGRSGSWVLMHLIPIVGLIYLIIWYCEDSREGYIKVKNKW